MNVILFSEVSAATVIGGAERVLSEQAHGLRQRGHRVSIVARAPAGDPRPETALGDVPEYRYMVAQSGPAWFVLRTVLGSLRAMRRTRPYQEPTVLVVHQALAGLGPVLRHPRLPVVYVCHSLAHEEYLSRNPACPGVMARLQRRLSAWVRRLVEQIVLRRSRRVVVLSEFMRRRVITVHGLSEDRIRVIAGGVDPGYFRPADDRLSVRERLGLPRQGALLVTVRNLVPRMGLERLIEAMVAVRGWHADVRLVIGGEGPLRPSLELLVKELGLEGHVQLVGFVPEQDLVSYYQAADLVVMPTLELEGFGLVTIEALACGTPVLGTPVGAIPEVLHDLAPDLITAATDRESLALGIRQVLGRLEAGRETAQAMARACRHLVETRYTWAHHLGALDSVLHECL